MTIDRGFLAGKANGHPPLDYVRRLAAHGFGVRVEELTGRSRERPLVEYRQVTMAAIRTLTPLSYPAIGREFDRDHTTVMHAVERVDGGRHHPAGSKRRRMWETMDTLCHEVRKQWAIDTGAQFPNPNQMDMDALAANVEPTVEFS